MSLRARLRRLENRLPLWRSSGCSCCDKREWTRSVVLFEGEPECRCSECGRLLNAKGAALGPGYGTILVLEGTKAAQSLSNQISPSATISSTTGATTAAQGDY